MIKLSLKMGICNFCFLEFSLGWQDGPGGNNACFHAWRPEFNSHDSPAGRTDLSPESCHLTSIHVLQHVPHPHPYTKINKWTHGRKRYEEFCLLSRLQIVCNNFTNVYFNHLLFPKFRRVSWDCFSLTPKSWEFSCFSTDPDQCVEELLALNTSLVLVSTSLWKGKWGHTRTRQVLVSYVILTNYCLPSLRKYQAF